MGFVRFVIPGSAPRPGFHTDGRVVDLPDFLAEVGDVPMSESGYFSQLGHIAEAVEREPVPDSAIRSIDEVTVVLPIRPRTVVCLEGCYEQDLDTDVYDPHLEGEDFHQQDWPSVSVAPPSALRGPDENLRLPSYADDVRPGGEIGFVVGSRLSDSDPNEVVDAITGYTAVTTLRIFDAIPNIEGYKMYDGSFAVGPSVVPLENEPGSLSLDIEIDDELVERRSSNEWRFSFTELITQASRITTLQPGDIVLTGCPNRIEDSIDEGTTVTTRVQESGPFTVAVNRDVTHVE
jgi:2-keto-4-pentenoate hydratase/2-oxohepta-3-ene-1,7-dioic acid hydratase in catechol pathway